MNKKDFSAIFNDARENGKPLGDLLPDLQLAYKHLNMSTTKESDEK